MTARHELTVLVGILKVAGLIVGRQLLVCVQLCHIGQFGGLAEKHKLVQLHAGDTFLKILVNLTKCASSLIQASICTTTAVAHAVHITNHHKRRKMGEMKYHQWLSRNPSGIDGHSISKLNRLVIDGAICLLVATATFAYQHVDLKLGINFLTARWKTETTISRPDERTFVALVRVIFRVFVTGQMLGERDSL